MQVGFRYFILRTERDHMFATGIIDPQFIFAKKKGGGDSGKGTYLAFDKFFLVDFKAAHNIFREFSFPIFFK